MTAKTKARTTLIALLVAKCTGHSQRANLLKITCKKPKVTLQETSYMVKDIRKGMNVPADTVYEVLEGRKEQGSSL